MKKLGLWSPHLDEVDVWLVPVSLLCYGWFEPTGDIYVPSVTGVSLSDLVTGQHTRLIDILRHEWSHAFADRRAPLVNSQKFIAAFGGAYESLDGVGNYRPDLYLTHYAATNPCEDFAETFQFYLRHKGRIPVRLKSKPEIVSKWSFIHWLSKQASG